MIRDLMTWRGTLPFTKFTRLPNFDDVFEFLNSSPVDSQNLPVDVEETDKEFIVTMDMPGVNKNDLCITVEDGTMIVSCQREEQKSEECKNFLRKERQVGKLSRSFKLPNIEERLIDASLKNGVLTLTMNKLAEENKKIKVNIK